MDEITLLRLVREDVDPPARAVAAAGREALEARIGGRAKRRYPALWITGATVVAAGVVAALVLTDVVGLGGWRGGAQPAAAAVLHEAAIAAIRTSDPVLRPGQYLKVSTDAVYGAFTDDAGYLSASKDQLYIPADKTDDWVWVRDPSTVAQTFGAASERAAAADAAHARKPEIVRAAEGAFYNGKPQDNGLDALPRDPTRLLNHIYRVTLGAGVSRDGEALVFIADTLRTGVVPADLRAALYEAAARIPGVEVTDDEANLDGHTGVALGRDESNGIRQEIIIDPDNGQLIGERQVLLRSDIVPGWPAGTPEGYTAVSTTIVDHAPTGGTTCGEGGEPVGGAGSGMCRISE